MSIGWIYQSHEGGLWQFSEEEPGDWVFFKKQIVYAEVI